MQSRRQIIDSIINTMVVRGDINDDASQSQYRNIIAKFNDRQIYKTIHSISALNDLIKEVLSIIEEPDDETEEELKEDKEQIVYQRPEVEKPEDAKPYTIKERHRDASASRYSMVSAIARALGLKVQSTQKDIIFVSLIEHESAQDFIKAFPTKRVVKTQIKKLRADDKTSYVIVDEDIYYIVAKSTNCKSSIIALKGNVPQLCDDLSKLGKKIAALD